MLSLNHLSPSTISPQNLRAALIEISDRIPSNMQLPADPKENIWYFYNTLTCSAYLYDTHILVVLPVPLLNNREKYEVYRIHQLPMPLQIPHRIEKISLPHSIPGPEVPRMAQIYDDNEDYIAEYELEVNSLMINYDRTKYALLKPTEFRACNNRHTKFCNPKNAMYQINLSKSCVIALFLKQKQNVLKFCHHRVSREKLPLARYIRQGLWAVGTISEMKFTIVCETRSNDPEIVTISPPLGFVNLNQSCRASNSYLSLPMYFTYENPPKAVDNVASLLKYHVNHNITLWQEFNSKFANLPSLEIPDSLSNLKQIPMPNFIDAIQKYQNVKLKYTPANTLRIMAYTFGGVNGGLLLAVVLYFCRNRLIKKARNIRFQWQANTGKGKGEAMELPRVDQSTLSQDSVANGEKCRLSPTALRSVLQEVARRGDPGVMNIYPKLSELGKVDETQRPIAV